jgi:phenylalanine-4-hydroxylase
MVTELFLFCKGVNAMSFVSLQTKKIPPHLKRYIARQKYERYTPIDQAVWRYVMRQNVHFFKERAHAAYQDGLAKTGILIERIPRIEEMDQCLSPFGWGAVPIDGLIPGVAFFEFQANGLLPIATDIRTLGHIAYTPAPDIIHEAAGHAPILSDETYARYVKTFGKIGAKALASREENEVFQATRRLTQVMENPESTPDDIRKAEQELQEKRAAATTVSEATLISRLYWWTVEYGLIGDCDNPKIYGAGLLSSIGEGQHCLSDQVRKLPFDLETCIATDYDVTRPQPQLFVCRDFEQLIDAVETFSARMAFRTGGTEGLQKAIASGDVATVEYNTGLQVSGVFTHMIRDDSGEAVYMKTTGPTALAFHGNELPRQGTKRHASGFGAPIGRVVKQNGSGEPGSTIDWHWESGLRVTGRVSDRIEEHSHPLLLTLTDCTVTYRGETLFHPDWGEYDLVIGREIVSVFAGAADPGKYYADEAEPKLDEEPVPSYSTLDHLYQAVREIREGKTSVEALPSIARTLDDICPGDWLLRLEILEICRDKGIYRLLADRIQHELEQLGQDDPSLHSLITNGMRLLNRGNS